MRLIDGDVLVMLLTDWWYASFGQTETQESKAIKAVLDQVKIHVEKHGCKPCEVGTQMSLPPHEDTISRQAAPNVPTMPPVYAVNADDVIENMEYELELCNRVLDDLDIVGTEREIRSRVAEMLREQIDFVKELPQVEPEPRKGKWIKDDVNMVVCSKCGGFRRDNRADHIGWCNKCGAKMEGK